MTTYRRRGAFWNCWTTFDIFKQSGYSPHSILVFSSVAGIEAIVPLASYNNLADMPSIVFEIRYTSNGFFCGSAI